jgi:hypothetical protein
MKRVQVFIGIFSVLTALSACSAKVQTVEWYKEHKAEREKMLAECRNNPGGRQSDPNCINASQAQFIGGGRNKNENPDPTF